ncbi:MAG: (d)CMP kinase [Gemmataceae bacterium]
MIVTIDGPAGAGKSSAARELARRLGVHFLDTGSMYRAVAYAVRQAGINADDEQAVSLLLSQVKLEFAPGVARLDGREVSSIRSPEITALSSRLAVQPAVRNFLVDRQRAIGENTSLVTEGRDQGTVVFPHAECKFFLVADPHERARRRHSDLLTRGETVTLDEVYQAQEERDHRDAQRHDGPMVPAEDAIVLDSTGLALDTVLERMEMEVRRCKTPSTRSSTKSTTESPSSR